MGQEDLIGVTSSRFLHRVPLGATGEAVGKKPLQLAILFLGWGKTVKRPLERRARSERSVAQTSPVPLAPLGGDSEGG